MWDSYPETYRSHEIQRLVRAARAGESSALVGLSGAGKSNVLGFLAHCVTAPPVQFVLVDCNRLRDGAAGALFGLMSRGLGAGGEAASLDALEAALAPRIASGAIVCFLLDRFDALGAAAPYGNLRALRDAHKYRVCYALGVRRPIDARNELAELAQGNTLWLGPLTDSDARWSIQRYAQRASLTWDRAIEDEIIARTRGYPSFLRGACEDRANGTDSALRARLDEFHGDTPSAADVRNSGLEGLALLGGAAPVAFDTDKLTAKELALLKYFQAHSGAVCEKDDIIRVVWGEDKAFVQGLRDDSLSQLVRRLREKIEPDPGAPTHIQTVAGRGYRFVG